MVNRSALLVTPKEPYIRWAEQLSQEGLSPREDPDRVVYLVPEVDNPDSAERIIKAAFKAVFEHELWAWHRDEADWPQKRDYKTFLEWFDVEINGLILDLVGYPLTREDLTE